MSGISDGILVGTLASKIPTHPLTDCQETPRKVELTAMRLPSEVTSAMAMSVNFSFFGSPKMLGALRLVSFFVYYNYILLFIYSLYSE